MNKRIVMSIAAGLVLVAATAWPASAQTSSPLCNNNLIRGTYGFTLEGQKLGGPGLTGPQVGVAMTTFDGAGNLTQTDTVTIAGTTVADFTHPQADGTYTVNSDCTGTFTINFQDNRPTVVVNFVVVDEGKEIDTVVIQPGVLATRSIGKRRFSSPL